MRLILSENMSVGLLLFDEPNASLGPVAERNEGYMLCILPGESAGPRT